MYLGIDGGGTRLRVALCDDQFAIIAQREFGSANPGSIGHDAARRLLHEAVLETLAAAHVDAGAIVGVGVGIAGASTEHSADWLQETMRGVLPDTFIALSSDIEIALVGAHGQAYGLLVLAGTGSAVYGINAVGEKAVVGGWGYLLGDEGSGYWIGNQALRLLTLTGDKRSLTPIEAESHLPQRIMEMLQFTRPKDLIAWLYGEPATAAARVAQLAPLVMHEAGAGDAYARSILGAAADHLAHMAQDTLTLLHEPDLPIAFAGGLLENDNPLRHRLCALLGLPESPISRHPPVVGAAILAKLRLPETG